MSENQPPQSNAPRSAEELLRRYRQGERDFARANLAGVSLVGVNLMGVSLRGADLRGANLNNAILFNTDLRDANLTGANLRGANLSESNLTGANLVNINLDRADLMRANLSGVKFNKDTFKGAKVSGVKLEPEAIEKSKEVEQVKVPSIDVKNKPLSRETLLPQKTILQNPHSNILAPKMLLSIKSDSVDEETFENNPPLNAKEFLMLYQNGKRDFSGANLSGALLTGSDLRGINLKGAILTNANLKEVNFREADLQGAQLNGAILTSVNFVDAKLNNAQMLCVELSAARFIGANLAKANLSGSNLESTKFIDTNLEHANLTNTKLINTDFRKANLKNADLRLAILTDSYFEYALLSGAKFDPGALEKIQKSLINNNDSPARSNSVKKNISTKELLTRYQAGERNFTDVNLAGAILRWRDLRGVNLSEANLAMADLRSNFFEANFNKADLSKSNLEGANLVKASLLGAKLVEANLCGAKLENANLCEADLRNAKLMRADLPKANLSGANLRGADFSNANLRNADLTNADLVGAKFDSGVLEKLQESRQPRIEVRHEADVLGLHRILVRVLSMESGPHEIILEVFGNPALQVAIKDAPKSRFQENTVWIPTQETWTEVFFSIHGVAQGLVSLSVTTSGAKLCKTEALYRVLPAIVPKSLVTEAVPPWLLLLPEEIRPIFTHLETHELITEEEAVRILGTPRLLRRFADQLEAYSAHAPFSVKIEPTPNGKRYRRERK